jgi:Mor family transcriptional regulator
MALVTNYDLFQDFFNLIKSGASEKKVLEEYGGSSLYIPSYKSIHRNDEIKKEYIKLKKDKCKLVARTLAKQHNLSEAQILNITKELRKGGAMD